MDIKFYDDQSETGTQLLLAIDEEGNVLGELEYQVKDGVVEVTDIYVLIEMEDVSIENKLLDELLDRIKQSDTVYYVYSVFPENEDSKYMMSAFEDREKFYILEDTNLYYINPEDRQNNLAYEKMKKVKGEVTRFSDIDMPERKHFYGYLENNQIDFFSPKDEIDLLDDLSFCTVDKKREMVTTCILFKKKAEKEIELSYMMKAPGHEKELVFVMAEAMRVIDEYYSDYLITIDTLSAAAEVLVDKIFGEKVKKETICTVFNV